MNVNSPYIERGHAEVNMTSDWNVETYRARERKWRQQAEKALSAKERDACLLIADGYANLIAAIETANSPAKRTAV